MSADPGWTTMKAKKMMTVWICLATLAWPAMAKVTCWDSDEALHDPLTLLLDPEPPVGKHSRIGFLPAPVWKFLKVSGAADISDLSMPQFRCSNKSLYLRILKDRHSDLRLQDGRSLLLLLDRCHGSVWTFGPWLLLEFPYTSCPVALKISNGTWFRQMKVSYFDYLQKANVMAAISCEHPASSRCVATPAVSCRSTKILVRLPLGGRLHRVKGLAKDVVLKRILTTSGTVFVQISTQSDTDSILEITYLDSAGDMFTFLAACRVKQGKLYRHPRALWDSNVAANYPYSTEISQPIEARDETEILERRESLFDEDNAVFVGTTLTQVAYSDLETIKIPDVPSCENAEEQDDMACCEQSDDLPCCDPLDDLPCCTSSEEDFPCGEHSQKHPSRFPHGPFQGFSSSQYSSSSEPISVGNQSTLNGGQPKSEGSLTVPYGTFSEGSSKSTATSDQQAHSRVHSVWHEGKLVEIPSKDHDSHSVSQTIVFGSKTVQQTSSESLNELLSRPGSHTIKAQPTSGDGQSSGLLTSGVCSGGPPGAQSSPVGSSQQALPSGEALCKNGPPGSQPSLAEQSPSVSLQMPFLGGVDHITSAREDASATSNHKGHPLKSEELPSKTGEDGREKRPFKVGEGGHNGGGERWPSKGGEGGREGRPSKGGKLDPHGQPFKGVKVSSEGHPAKGAHEGHPSKGGEAGHEGSGKGHPSKGGEAGREGSGKGSSKGHLAKGAHEGHPSKGGEAGREGSGKGHPSKGGEAGREGSGQGHPTKGGEGRGQLVATLTKLLGNQHISSHGGHPSKAGEGHPSKDHESYSSVIQATLFDHQRGHAPSLESPHGFFSSGGSQLPLGDGQQIKQTSTGDHPISVHSGEDVQRGESGLEGYFSKGGEFHSKGGESRPSSDHKGSGESRPSSGRKVGHEGRHKDFPFKRHEGGRGGPHEDRPSSHQEGDRRGNPSSGRDDGGRQGRPSSGRHMGKDNTGRHL